MSKKKKTKNNNSTKSNTIKATNENIEEKNVINCVIENNDKDENGENVFANTNNDKINSNANDNKHVIVSKNKIVTINIDALKNYFKKFKINYRNIVIITVSLLLTIFLMFFIYPIVKNSKASDLIKNERYEEAIDSLNIISFNPKTNKIRKQAEYQIAYRAATDLLNKSSKFSSHFLEIEEITNFEVLKDDINEIVNFSVKYNNDNYSLNVTCKTRYIKNNDNWELKNYDIANSSYDIKTVCDRSLIDNYVSDNYHNAKFIKESESESLYKKFIYEYKTNDENPYINSVYNLTTLCIYDVNLNKWMVNDIRKIKIDEEQIPLKKFTTSIFTIELPESWIMKIDEEYYNYEFSNKENQNYNYSYVWWPNEDSLEEFYGGQTKDGYSKSIFEIYVNYNNRDYNYYINNRVESNYSSSSLGNGTVSTSEYNSGCNGVFYPSLFNLDGSFYIYGNYTEKDNFKNIIDSIKLKNTSYEIEVVCKNLNIRNAPGTKYTDIVGHLSNGNKTTASRIRDYEGYRWYNIDENKWIADLNGEYLSVTYK